MKLNVKYSDEKDAQTYVDFVYKFKGLKHGRVDPQGKLLSALEPELQEILASAEDEETAYKEVLEYLTRMYDRNPLLINDSMEKLSKTWEKVGANIICSLEFLYGNPFPFELVTAYLTTNNIFPYNYKERYFYVNYKYLTSQLTTAKHELNHFMFYYYYGHLKDVLGDNEKYELLKESLTFFSNPEQEGKPNEKLLRELFRSKIWKDLNEAIETATQYLKNN